jgi:hypothetical protein
VGRESRPHSELVAVRRQIERLIRLVPDDACSTPLEFELAIEVASVALGSAEVLLAGRFATPDGMSRIAISLRSALVVLSGENRSDIRGRVLCEIDRAQSWLRDAPNRSSVATASGGTLELESADVAAGLVSCFSELHAYRRHGLTRDPFATEIEATRKARAAIEAWSNIKGGAGNKKWDVVNDFLALYGLAVDATPAGERPRDYKHPL